MSPEQVNEVLAKALSAIEEADIPDDLREAAFKRAVDLLTAGVPSTPSGATAPPPPAAQVEHEGDASEDPLAKIAEGLGVRLAAVRSVYRVRNGDLELEIAPRALSESRAQATREIAYLLITARQLAGFDDEETSTETIRAAAQDFGKYDSPNFSRHLSPLRNELRSTSTGFRSNRAVQETAKELIHKMAEEHA